MGMDYIDYRNANRFHCPDCGLELHPEAEEWSIARAEDRGQTCEDCKLEEINKEAMRLSNERKV